MEVKLRNQITSADTEELASIYQALQKLMVGMNPSAARHAPPVRRACDCASLRRRVVRRWADFPRTQFHHAASEVTDPDTSFWIAGAH